jgi:hypothetical protein
MKKFRGLWVALAAIVAVLAVGFTVQTIENLPSGTPVGSDLGTYYHFTGSQYQVMRAPLSQLAGGYFSNITTTVAVPNTNQLWVTGAGTTAANSEYVLDTIPASHAALVNGYVYTNILSTGGVPNSYVCAAFGGANTGNGDAKPFYMGTTTNDIGTITGGSTYWYFSSVSPVAYWTSTDDIQGPGEGSGANPPPTATYSTNYVSVTTPVFFCPTFFGSAFTNGLLYVSQQGNDILASNLQCAFATCQAAKNFASAGDTIDVLPGYYNDRDLLKNGVDWQFEKGTTIGWDVNQLDTNPRGIFDDYVGAVTSTITGDRLHYTDVLPIPQSCVLLTNPLDCLTIHFNRADCDVYLASTAPTCFPGSPTLPVGPLVTFFSDNLAQYVDAQFNVVSGFTNVTRQYLDANDNSGTYGTYISVAPTDSGFGWGGGECHIHVHNLTVNGAGLPYAFVSDNNGSTETSCFFTADTVNGYMYWEDSNPTARTWFNVAYAVGPHSGVPALEYHGKAVNYYTGQKIAATGIAPFVADDSSGLSPFKLWINVQKVTQNGAGPWLNLSGTGSQIWWNVMNFEDNSGGTMSGGININGGTNYFSGGYASMLSSQPDVEFSGGQALLQGMTLQAIGTNYPLMLIGNTTANTSVTNNALTLQNDILHSQTAANSIWATNNFWIYGVFMGDVAPTNFVHLNGTTYYHAQAPQ